MITEFPSTIEDIVTTFQSQQMPNVSQDTQLWILMEVLGGIPEEVSPHTEFVQFWFWVRWLNAHSISSLRWCLRLCNGRPYATRSVSGHHLWSISWNNSFYRNWIKHWVIMICQRCWKQSNVPSRGWSKGKTMRITRKSLVANHPFVCFVFPVDRSGSFALENCEVLTSSLLKVISKCYWTSTESDGCMSAEENELSEACIKTLTVSAHAVAPPPLPPPAHVLIFSLIYFHFAGHAGRRY